MLDKKYKIYVHVFPDGKRYVGCTCKDAKERWNGGLGYENQRPVFGAILKYGWDSIRHYIIMEGLDKEDAKLYEAAFIYHWKTYKKSYGYNTVLPNIAEAKEINVPRFIDCKKTRVDDIRGENLEDRIDQRYSNYKGKRKVLCIETGKIYQNIKEAYDDYIDKYTSIYENRVCLEVFRMYVRNGSDRSGDRSLGSIEHWDEENNCPGPTTRLHWKYVE